jgi:hypothetical protein
MITGITAAIGKGLLKYWRWWVYPLVILSIFFTGYCGIQSCSKSRETKKEGELRDDENFQKGALEVQRQITENANVELQKRSENSNQANADFDTVQRTESNKFNSNFSAVKRKFCAQNPTDPACQ